MKEKFSKPFSHVFSDKSVGQFIQSPPFPVADINGFGAKYVLIWLSLMSKEMQQGQSRQPINAKRRLFFVQPENCLSKGTI